MCASSILSWSLFQLKSLRHQLWHELNASPSSSITKKRVKKRQPFIKSYVKTWMLLGCYMVQHFLNGVPHPLDSALQFGSHLLSTPFIYLGQAGRRFQDTYTTSCELGGMVELNYSTLLQYNRLRLFGLVHGFDFFEQPNAFSEDVASPLHPSVGATSSPVADGANFSNYFSFDNELSSTDWIHQTLSDPPFYDCIWDDTDDFYDCNIFTVEEEKLVDLFSIEDLFPTVHTLIIDKEQPIPSDLPLSCNVAIQAEDFLSLSSNQFPVVFDSGASRCISGYREDFIGPLAAPSKTLQIGGMASGKTVEGIGTVRWSFLTKNRRSRLVIQTSCYYVPNCKVRLISPQRLFHDGSSKGNSISGGEFICRKDTATLSFNDLPTIEIDYDTRNHLPIGMGTNSSSTSDSKIIPVNLSITSEANQNLTPSQRNLLHWHYRFGHRNFQAIQRMFRQAPFVGKSAFDAASKCLIPTCEICEYAKAHRKSTKGSIHKPNSSSDGNLSDGHLRPGASVSVDHFESRLLGRTYTSFGRTTSEQYKGGCIFVDHMSGYLHVEHQLGFSASETIRAKQSFEKMALDSGVVILNYLGDNGVFSAKDFVKHIQEHNQRISYCGVNAHHQNAMAERSIRTVSEMARALLLHASTRWKGGIDSSLWPMAVDYATYIYNRCPNSHGVAPIDLFTGTTLPRHDLTHIHVWGAPVYVLDPKLQSGKKLPRWEPRSRQGIFVGYSAQHGSNVPLVLNRSTGSISPQFHVVFDDSFSSVLSIAADADPPHFWNEIDLLPRIHKVPLDETIDPRLSDEWLSPEEMEERRRMMSRSKIIEDSFDSLTHLPTDRPSTPSLSNSDCQISESPSSEPSTPTIDNTSDSMSIPPSNDPPIPSKPPTSKPPSLPPSNLRRSTRQTSTPSLLSYSSNFQQKDTVPIMFSNIVHPNLSVDDQVLAYQAQIETDIDSGLTNCMDTRAYLSATKVPKEDSDTPSFFEAMSGQYKEEYEKAMKEEIISLIKRNTWTCVLRSQVPMTAQGKKHPVLKSTWAFKLKRFPDGSVMKFKARFCVRGDQQVEGIDFFDTYAPVVQWSTIRLLLTLILHSNWVTKQVDYTNAFAQAKLKEQVFIEPPKGFSIPGGADKVLRLNTSLYGLRQAPATFFEKLRDGLMERGFTQSQHDPCLFMKKDLICVVYVDDTIIAGPDVKAIDKLIQDLGVIKGTWCHQFELRDEGSVGDFLGIRIKHIASNKFLLTQPGLIHKVLEAAGMQDCHPVSTPAVTTPLGSDKHGRPFQEEWEYASIIGMLMYLANNSRPDIAFAVHQCARFTHSPRHSHSVAIKRILRYLKGTETKGMFLEPSPDFVINCYVDADFAGLWKVEDDQDPICVKSRSGYLLTFMNCPIMWVSKLQTQIALSTMEAEYIALSQSMRDLIHIRGIVTEINKVVFTGSRSDPKLSTHNKSFIPQSSVYEDNASCLKFATAPKMSSRTKHIAIPYHFFRSKVNDLEVKVVSISTDNQLGDQFTKGLPEPKFVRDRKRLMGW